MRIALVARDEVYPVHGGGIGRFVSAAAALLSRIAEVTVFLTARLEPRYEELRAAAHPGLPPESVRFVFVPEPTEEEAGAWYHIMHCYSARVYDALREVYGDEGPDLIEFADYLGEGFVTVQAAQTLDPFLAGTRLCVRAHTSAELCEVLNGFCKPDFGSRTVHELERYVLAHADHLIWQGGDILGAYGRFYGAERLAPATCIPYPYAGPVADDAEEELGDRPLRLLYAGRLERRKGVANLVEAVTGLDRDDFTLTLVGADTSTGPLGVSVRGMLELSAADDPRIEILDALDSEQLAATIRAHDVVVIPSVWECWPYAALEPLHLNRPLLGTPVGGLLELVEPGRSGWLASGADPVALAEAVEAALDDREGLAKLIGGGHPRAHGRELSDGERVLGGYEQLLRTPLRRPVRSLRHRAEPPLVSAIVPYYRASRYVREAVQSLLAQTYTRLEVIVVNDGSFDEADWVIAELAVRRPVRVVTQMNQGLGAARNFGVSQSHGRYFFPLDSDNLAEPEFVERCVEVLEHRPEAAYVTSWSRYIEDGGAPRPGPDPGYEPLGNQAALIEEDNVAGDAAALLRRSLFDAGFRYSEELTSYEDWALYRRLREAGHFGCVIPERLLRYRVHSNQMQVQIAQPNRGRLMGEIEAHIQENRTAWIPPSA